MRGLVGAQYHNRPRIADGKSLIGSRGRDPLSFRAADLRRRFWVPVANRRGATHLRDEIVPIASLTLEIRIEHAQSLKDRRQVVRSLKDKLRASFNVAVSELEPESQGMWNRATIGVVSVSDSRDYLRGLMEKVERAATRIANNAGGEVVDAYLEIE